jgi:AcrR family transcriptional regulator
MTDLGSSPSSGSERERIIDAFMALLAERPIERIGFAEIAARTGLTLAQCRAQFGSVLGILAAHIEATDRRVLEQDDSDMAEEPVRERLFDVLMRRLEVLAPHKAAVRSLMRSARCDPALALFLNRMAVQSQAWMMTAAGIDATGPRGAVRAQGLACLFGRVLRTWIHDDDPGLAPTMAALDRELARGARWAGFLDDLWRLSPLRLFCPAGGRSRRWPREAPGAEEAPSPAI